jgi:hypothetical protein
MEMFARSFACSIRMPSLGSGIQPETSECGGIAYVTMIASRCQRLGFCNLSRPFGILCI